MHRTYSTHTTRRGNLLVGCGIVLLVFILLIGVGAYFVMSNIRGWTAAGSTKAIDAVLTEANIDPAEHAEIMAHVETFMTRFEDGDVEWAQLGMVVEELVESPVIPAAMVLGIEGLYIADSDLEESEKAQARIDLARYTQGLCSETINEDSVADVLASVTTHSPDDNDIRLNLTIGANNQTVTALKSADEVSTEELQTLIATAKAKADEAGITQTPEPIDLSDEIAKVIAIALGEITGDTDEEAVEDISDDAPTPDDGP